MLCGDDVVFYVQISVHDAHGLEIAPQYGSLELTLLELPVRVCRHLVVAWICVVLLKLVKLMVKSVKKQVQFRAVQWRVAWKQKKK